MVHIWTGIATEQMREMISGEGKRTYGMGKLHGCYD